MASELIRSEVQVLRIESTAVNASSDSLAGSFRLTWGDGGEETDYLPADVGEVELEAALEALTDVRDVQVCGRDNIGAPESLLDYANPNTNIIVWGDYSLLRIILFDIASNWLAAIERCCHCACVSQSNMQAIECK